MFAKNRPAFTLIELLIVVAIIAILAAIAVPNFLEAQVRAKVSRAKADLRTMATAVESYAVDNNKPPVRRHNWDGSGKTLLPPFREKLFDPDKPEAQVGLRTLTTPIAYLTSLPADPFNIPARAYMSQEPYYSDCLDYMDPVQTDSWLQFGNGLLTDQTGRGKGWTLFSVGPDQVVGNSVANEGQYPPTRNPYYNSSIHMYDPSNGTISSGNIYRFQGGLEQKDIFFRQALPSGSG